MSETEKKRTIRRISPEARAMTQMERHLEGLTRDAQHRVIAYLQSKVLSGAVEAKEHHAPTRQLAFPDPPAFNGLGQPTRLQVEDEL